MSATRDLELDSLRSDILDSMYWIQQRFPPGTILTVMARCSDSEGADFLLSDEESIDRIIRSLEVLKVQGEFRK